MTSLFFLSIVFPVFLFSVSPSARSSLVSSACFCTTISRPSSEKNHQYFHLYKVLGSRNMTVDSFILQDLYWATLNSLKPPNFLSNVIGPKGCGMFLSSPGYCLNYLKVIYGNVPFYKDFKTLLLGYIFLPAVRTTNRHLGVIYATIIWKLIAFHVSFDFPVATRKTF